MKNTTINYRRLLVTAGGISLLIYYLFQWVQMISDPTLRTSVDFVAYYSAARIAQESGGTDVYDISRQHQMEERVVGFPLADEQVLLYLHMPYLIPLLFISVDENYVASFIRWVLPLVFIYGVSFLLIGETLRKNPAFRQDLMWGVISFFPCFVSLLLGQSTALLFFGVTLLAWGLVKGKNWPAAIGLALITLRPQIMLLLIIPFFIMHRDIFWRFLMVSGALGILSVAVLGLEGTANFIEILSVSSRGQWYGLNVDAMVNLNGFMLRNLSFLGPVLIRQISWGMYLLGIPLLCVLAVHVRKADFHVLSLMILICIILVPHLHYHDLALLIFPLLSASLRDESNPLYRRVQVIFHPMIVSFLFLFGVNQKTFFPSLIVLALFLFLFRKRNNAAVNHAVSV
jgi:hypothetical protein